MNRRSLYRAGLLLLLLTIITAGCWDNKDLERRALVLGAAVDLAAAGGSLVVTEPWKITLEMPILRRMVTRGEGGGGGGEGQDENTMPTWRLTLTGTTFAEAINKAATRSERTLFFGHQKILLMGEELARRGDLRSVLDWWARNRESYLAIDVLLAEGSAGDIMEARPKFARSVSLFLHEQMQQVIKTSRFVKHSLAEVLAALDAGQDILLAGVKMVPRQELEVSGAGVIREGRLAGWLTPEETQAALWITGETKGCDILVVPVPELQQTLSVEFGKLQAEVKPLMEEDKLSFTIKIKVEGKIAEKMGNPKLFAAADLHQVENRAARLMEERIRQVLGKLQQQYQADVLGFGRKVEKVRPRQWEAMKGQWRQIYSSLPVTVQVKVSIRRTGMVS
ncbi:Ger(x)C family spore germination protein [Neomoorella mulderi]|uniref:Spore germination protein B3 n=1 Tax=Moorella mulderi DSM 14980 TaxID=1122241 RepID=A0A151AU26_9FIRM|nr:Ger(x)C family spore germination protein [Moorella mulderi]KYH31156.1 spore germination protein B3 precursor [Moorella mulderi DSM 14980]